MGGHISITWDKYPEETVPSGGATINASSLRSATFLLVMRKKRSNDICRAWATLDEGGSAKIGSWHYGKSELHQLKSRRMKIISDCLQNN